ncbi:MAG: phospholipid carrier-dependent glycosyltransferase [Oscillatoriales cyanobacterium RM2_1_1]|nr:phospholipid carrier-dependent glycosyltransferase [Oscillatoriales cyanobacterium RM2_1_1]
MTYSSSSRRFFQERLPRNLVVMLSLAIAIGIAFRFIALDRKVYWHDEVYTNLRAGGYTLAEVYPEFFQNRVIQAPRLQAYQSIKPGSTARDTLHSLATEDPQHPPLYFLMARIWMKGFGSSITASRLLPAFLSLMALPFMYGLAWELFQNRLTALLATAFLALSPFDILFAQTARQYSLLTVTVIASSYFLLRAIGTKRWSVWGFYSVSCAVGLYTHPFFGLTLAGHGAYVLLAYTSWARLKQRKLPELRNFLVALGLSLLLYSPWLIVLARNLERAFSTTNWAAAPVRFIYPVKLWILSFTSLFIDINFDFYNPWMYILRIPVLLLIFYALYWVHQHTSPATYLFILTSIFVPFLMLVLPDLLLGGKRSAVSRYLISCYPGVQLAMSYLIASHINTRRFSLVDGERLWRSGLAILFTASLVSCGLSAGARTWWSKDLSYFNAAVAVQINAAATPLVVIDQGDDWTNLGDTISLSYLLKDEVKLLLVSPEPDLNLIPANAENVYSFRPSSVLKLAFEKQNKSLKLLLPSGRLWQVQK